MPSLINVLKFFFSNFKFITNMNFCFNHPFHFSIESSKFQRNVKIHRFVTIMLTIIIFFSVFFFVWEIRIESFGKVTYLCCFFWKVGVSECKLSNARIRIRLVTSTQFLKRRIIAFCVAVCDTSK